MTSRRVRDPLLVLATLAFSVACAVLPLIDPALGSDLPVASEQTEPGAPVAAPAR